MLEVKVTLDSRIPLTQIIYGGPSGKINGIDYEIRSPNDRFIRDSFGNTVYRIENFPGGRAVKTFSAFYRNRDFWNIGPGCFMFCGRIESGFYKKGEMAGWTFGYHPSSRTIFFNYPTGDKKYDHIQIIPLNEVNDNVDNVDIYAFISREQRKLSLGRWEDFVKRTIRIDKPDGKHNLRFSYAGNRPTMRVRDQKLLDQLRKREDFLEIFSLFVDGQGPLTNALSFDYYYGNPIVFSALLPRETDLNRIIDSDMLEARTLARNFAFTVRRPSREEEEAILYSLLSSQFKS